MKCRFLAIIKSAHLQAYSLMTFKKIIFFFVIFICPYSVKCQAIALINAHSHNDYKHKHPLVDALKNGFTSVEADIFLKNNKLIVAHFSPFLKRHQTLEALYLKPLFDSLIQRNGNLYAPINRPFILLIDIKTDPEKTYKTLIPLLEKYSSILSGFEKSVFTKRAVTIILTGNKPFDLILNQSKRHAFIDENLMIIKNSPHDMNYCPLSSCRYSDILNWKGNGKIPETEKQKLKTLIECAHKQGKLVRLWDSPENQDVWKELLDAGVDLINTDELEKLKEFLLLEN